MLLQGSNASTVLTWVRPDLDKHLNQIRTQIEHIASSDHVGNGVINAADNLTQLKYTFEALVLQGATLVVEEMISVCDELKRSNIHDRDKAIGALMDAKMSGFLNLSSRQMSSRRTSHSMWLPCAHAANMKVYC